jgi:hypothetical protein
MDFSFAYFMPMIVFLLVFIVMFALLAKTKVLGGSPFIHLFTSFLVAVIFIASPALTDLTKLALPWVMVLIVILISILLVVGFVKGNLDSVTKNPVVTVAIIVAIIIIFLISAINVFGPIVKPYLPTATSEAGGSPDILQIKHVLFSPSTIGMIVLMIVAAIASWIVTKKK